MERVTARASAASKFSDPPPCLRIPERFLSPVEGLSKSRMGYIHKTPFLMGHFNRAGRLNIPVCREAENNE